jgi:hypothetical protein
LTKICSWEKPESEGGLPGGAEKTIVGKEKINKIATANITIVFLISIYTSVYTSD